MLASTVQFSSYGRRPPRTPAPTHQPPHPQGRRRQASGSPTRRPRTNRPPTRGSPVAEGNKPKPDPSGPNSVPGAGPPPRPVPTPPPEGKRSCTRTGTVMPTPTNRCSPLEHPPRNTRPRQGPGPRPPPKGCRRQTLLRKEVIQPHLPVRLPCYDLVPIASPTFDGSLPQGVGPPASGVTDFRDLTGGVYKARERIHRSGADLRLLATPTSWGRVADPNPN